MRRAGEKPPPPGNTLVIRKAPGMTPRWACQDLPLGGKCRQIKKIKSKRGIKRHGKGSLSNSHTRHPGGGGGFLRGRLVPKRPLRRLLWVLSRRDNQVPPPAGRPLRPFTQGRLWCCVSSPPITTPPSRLRRASSPKGQCHQLKQPMCVGRGIPDAPPVRCPPSGEDLERKGT